MINRKQIAIGFSCLLLGCEVMAQGYQPEFGLGAYQQGRSRGQEDALLQQQQQMNQMQMLQQVAALIKQKCREDGFAPGTQEFSECTNKTAEAFLSRMQGR